MADEEKSKEEAKVEMKKFKVWISALTPVGIVAFPVEVDAASIQDVTNVVASVFSRDNNEMDFVPISKPAARKSAVFSSNPKSKS